MTQFKFKRFDKAKVKDKDEKNGLDKKVNSSFFINEKRIQACAWILLTIGLCIICSTFYLAIQHKPDFTDDTELDSALDNKANLVVIADDGVYRFNDGELLEPNINARIVLTDVVGVIGNNLSGCHEKYCQIACSQNEDIFSSLYETMRSSLCPSIDVLVLDKQDFPNDVLKNSWIPLNQSIHEVILRTTTLHKIKGSTFNSPLFRNTLLMSWFHMNIEKVESGALLGLFKLKYLKVESAIGELEPALFQPVQTTLVHLRLNSNLKINGKRNLFYVSYMNSLEYLDLSRNQFNGSLGKEFFYSTPNLKYIIFSECGISHIENKTFKALADKLLFVNLSKNLLTTLAAEVISPILLPQRTVMISLGDNSWSCDCELEELAALVKQNRLQFFDAVYCKAPHYLYGVSIDSVDFETCKVLTSTVVDTVEEKELSTVTAKTKITTSKSYVNTPAEVDNDDSSTNSGEVSSIETSNIFKMRCFSTEPTSFSSDDSSSSRSSSSRSSSSRSSDGMAGNLGVYTNNDVEYLQLPGPDHEFELELIPQNNTVIVRVQAEDPRGLDIIWFSEQSSDKMSYDSASFIYVCKEYSPSLVVGPLDENCTYTFCLLPHNTNNITPFNCLPLHVPLKRSENIWISEDNKQFTIGMLCLIFLLSTIAGALIAYFGIKTYPDLLEGSKNVLIVKKPDQACYVSTISEVEYQKQSSLKKKKLSTKEKPQLKKQNSTKLPLPATPCSETSSPFPMSVKDLERLSSLQSSSTCFEDTFPNYPFQNDEYETPKVCDNEYSVEQRSVPNKYGMSPGSPPPLPKRNSNISDSSTLVMNRFSTAVE